MPKIVKNNTVYAAVPSSANGIAYNGTTSGISANTVQGAIDEVAEEKADRVPEPAEYDSTATYNLGDFVTYNGNIYMCITAIATPEAWNSSHWKSVDTDPSYLHSLDPKGAGSFSLNRRDNTTVGFCSFAEGYNCVASGGDSHAEGGNTTASGNFSHAEGLSTTANHKSQHTFGEYNILDASTATASDRGNYVEIVGNGTGPSARSNARTLDWSGNEVLAGGLKLNGTEDVITTSKSASSGGTDLSLVTTGEKYTWDNKISGSGTANYIPKFNAASSITNGYTVVSSVSSGGAGLPTSGAVYSAINNKIQSTTQELSYSTATSLAYTGKSITCPSGHTYIVRAWFVWVNAKPLEIAASTKSSSWSNMGDFLDHATDRCYCHFIIDEGETAYFLAKCEAASKTNIIRLRYIDIAKS